MKNTLIFAHRGVSSLYPENTLASFQAAVRLGVDFIELDVRRTKDGALVVIHDETLDRTTDGKGKVADLTIEEIKRYSAGRWFSEKFSGEKIPTVQEVFSLVGRGKTKLWLEIKESGLEADPLELIRRYEMADCVVCGSFNLDTVIRLKRFNPALPAALIASSFDLKLTDTLRENGIGIVSLGYPSLDPGLLNRLQEQNFQVLAWTIDDPKEMKRFVEMGVDAIVTDCPQVLKAIKRLKNCLPAI